MTLPQVLSQAFGARAVDHVSRLSEMLLYVSRDEFAMSTHDILFAEWGRMTRQSGEKYLRIVNLLSVPRSQQGSLQVEQGKSTGEVEIEGERRTEVDVAEILEDDEVC